MNPTEQSDGEQFFEALAGRESGVAGAEQLRSALLAEERTLAEAETASPDDIPATELQRLDAIKAQLLASGTFSVLPPTSGTEPNRLSGRGEPKADFLSRLFNWLTPPRLAPFAIAATVTLAVLVTYQQQVESPTGLNETEVVRGGEIVEIQVENPTQTVAQIRHTLEQQGIEVVAVQLNEQAWAVQVRPINEAQRAVTARILSDLGINTGDIWPFMFRLLSKSNTASRPPS